MPKYILPKTRRWDTEPFEQPKRSFQSYYWLAFFIPVGYLIGILLAYFIIK